MNRYILIFAIIITPLSLSGQVGSIKELFDNEQYHTIIEKYASTDKKKLTAEELSNIGWSYHLLDNNEKAISYMLEAIKKTQNKEELAELYYLAGLIFFSDDDYENAFSYLSDASLYNPNAGDYYTAIGNIYLSEEMNDEAIKYYHRAIQAAEPSEQAYFMVAYMYDEAGKYDEALNAFYIARENISNDKDLYVTVLYNIGILEMEKKNYKKAIAVLSEVVEYSPDDYFSYTCLVQSCYALEDYTMGDIYKEELYKAYTEGDLTGSEFSDKFCIDNFIIDSKLISCYEFFQPEPEGNGDNIPLYIFYVINNSGIIEGEIQYTYISEGGTTTFKLLLYKTESGETSSVNFAEDIEYPKLKSIVKETVSKNYIISRYGFDIN